MVEQTQKQELKEVKTAHFHLTPIKPEEMPAPSRTYDGGKYKELYEQIDVLNTGQAFQVSFDTPKSASNAKTLIRGKLKLLLN